MSSHCVQKHYLFLILLLFFILFVLIKSEICCIIPLFHAFDVFEIRRSCKVVFCHLVNVRKFHFALNICRIQIAKVVNPCPLVIDVITSDRVKRIIGTRKNRINEVFRVLTDFIAIAIALDYIVIMYCNLFKCFKILKTLGKNLVVSFFIYSLLCYLLYLKYTIMVDR